MNCANHPDAPAAAYCQFCGKPLCDGCIHKVNNIVSCEPCLEARLGATSAVSGAAAQAGQNPQGAGYRYGAGTAIPPGSVQPNWTTEPWIAFLLGWIPGVGAMYNGQFAKALAHVVIFALLVDFCRYNGFLGVAVAAWVIYQVFDAYQTAVARRHGQPLPNPLGLNEVGQWFGARTAPTTNPWVGPTGIPNAANDTQNAANAGIPPVGNVGAGPGYVPAPGFVPPYVPPVAPPQPPNHMDPFYPYGPGGQWCGYGGNRGIHTGAVVLIVLGILFLLGNMGILSGHWLDRGWPLILIGIGVWMVIRHSQRQPPAGGTR